jgi:hypothetical protein
MEPGNGSSIFVIGHWFRGREVAEVIGIKIGVVDGSGIGVVLTICGQPLRQRSRQPSCWGSPDKDGLAFAVPNDK